MTGHIDKKPGVMEVKIGFDSSANLDWAIKNFLTPDARTKLGSRAIKLHTVQSSYHHLQSNNTVRDTERVSLDKLKSSLDYNYDHEFRLESRFFGNFVAKKGLSLTFHLRMQARERKAIVEEPIFPYGYVLPVGVGVILPTEYLLGESGRTIAVKSLNRQLGINIGGSSSEGAPWTVFVTHPTLAYKLPKDAARDDRSIDVAQGTV